VSNPSSFNELVFGEYFEFAVSLWMYEIAYRRSFWLSFCTKNHEVWVCMWQIELGQSSKALQGALLTYVDWTLTVRYQGRFFMEVNQIVLPRKDMNVGAQENINYLVLRVRS
jgi:hypothetical protein